MRTFEKTTYSLQAFHKARIIAGIISFIIMAMVASSASAGTVKNQSAANIYSQAVAKLKNAGGLTASFTMKSSQGVISGTLKSQGGKFAIVTKSYSTWYDGKSMWSYNPSSGETTLTRPSAADITSTNPMALLSSSGNYNVSFAKNKVAGAYRLILTPKSNKEGIKRIVVTLNSSSYLPTAFDVTPSSGARITVGISSIKTGQKLPSSSFTYPKKKYSKVPVVDLR